MLFYFDLYDDKGVARDRYGDDVDVQEISGLAAALVADHARTLVGGEEQHVFACEVRDESGAVVHRAELAFRSSSPVPGWIAMARGEGRRLVTSID